MKGRGEVISPHPLQVCCLLYWYKSTCLLVQKMRAASQTVLYVQPPVKATISVMCNDSVVKGFSILHFLPQHVLLPPCYTTSLSFTALLLLMYSSVITTLPISSSAVLLLYCMQLVTAALLLYCMQLVTQHFWTFFLQE